MTAGIAAIPLLMKKVAVSSQIASWPVCCRRCSTCSTCSTCGTCGTCGTCAHDGWMDTTNCRSRPCSPDVRIHGMYTVPARTHTCYLNVLIDVLHHLLSHSGLQKVTKRPVTDLTHKTQAVLPPWTVKWFLEVNKIPHKEGHAALT